MEGGASLAIVAIKFMYLGQYNQDNFFKIDALGSAILWQRKHPVFTNGLCLLKEGKTTFCWSDWSKQRFPTSS